MYPRILHIYGPFWIQTYGLMIVLGFLFFLFFTYYNKKRRSIIGDELFLNTLFLGLISGIIGGRALFVFYEWNNFSNWIDMLSVWQGGFVVLGTILAVMITLPIYLWWHNIEILGFLDFIAVYAPLMHAISRLGCLFSGCCYGAACSTCSFSLTFANPAGLAPINTPLYPTQIYACLASLLIFTILFLFKRFFIRKGQALLAFLSLECASRFLIDFYRGDRGDLTHFSFLNYSLSLSEIQIWTLAILLTSIVTFIFLNFCGKRS